MRSSSFYLSPLYNVTKGSITGKDKLKTMPRVGVNFNGGVVRYELLLLIFVVVFTVFFCDFAYFLAIFIESTDF